MDIRLDSCMSFLDGKVIGKDRLDHGGHAWWITSISFEWKLG